MSKRRGPAPFIDQWGKPTWDNPFGQLPANPEYVQWLQNGKKAAHAAEPQRAAASQPVPAPAAFPAPLPTPVAAPRPVAAPLPAPFPAPLPAPVAAPAPKPEPEAQADHERRPRRRRRGRRAVAGLAALALCGTAGVVWAYFTSTGSGVGAANAASLAPPTDVATTNAVGSSTVHVTWTGIASPGSGTLGYFVQRFDGPTPSAACGSSRATPLAATPTSCNDLNVPDGTYTYKVSAVYNSWSKTSAASAPVTVFSDTTPPAVSAPGVAADTTFGSNPVYVINETVHLTDVASDTGGTGVQSVAYYYCAGATGACTNADWTAIGSTTTAAGNWLVNWTSLPADGVYRVVAVGTDSAGNVSDSSNATLVGVDTSAPSVSAPSVSAAVTFGSDPVYVNNETVGLSVTASDGGSDVQSVQYFYCAGASGTCNGTAIATASSAGGGWAVTWATPLPADGVYRVYAVGTDNLGNVSNPSDKTLVVVDTIGPITPRPNVNGFS